MRASQLLETVAADLRNEGLRAEVDSQKLNPPCVWVALTNMQVDRLDGTAEATLQLTFVAPDHGTVSALDELTVMVAAAVDAVDLIGEIETIAVSLPNQGNTPLPAFRTEIPGLEIEL